MADETFRVGGGDTGVPPGDPPTPRSTPFMPDNLDTEFEKLLAQLEQANPPPVPLTNKQRMAASFSGFARGWQGLDRDPTRAEKQQAEQAERHEAGKLETTRLRISDVYRQRERVASERKAEETARRAEELQARKEAEIRERQVLDDQRAEQRADREKGLALIDGLIDKPGFVLPDQESLKTMTRARAQSLAQAYWQSKGVDPNMANFALWQRETQAQMPQGTEMSSATLPVPGGGQATFTKPKPEEPIPADKPVSVQTMARAERANVPLTGKESEIEASNLIEKSVETERDKKFNKITSRGNKTYDEIVLWMQVEDSANRALAYGSQYGGPIQGSMLSTPYLAIMDWKNSSDELIRKYEYNGLLAGVATNKRKAQSGAAVTPQEGAWMEPLIPSAMDLDAKRGVNLKELARGAREAYLGRAAFAKLTDEDLGVIRQRMFGALPPLPTQPGDIPIGDSY